MYGRASSRSCASASCTRRDELSSPQSAGEPEVASRLTPSGVNALIIEEPRHRARQLLEPGVERGGDAERQLARPGLVALLQPLLDQAQAGQRRVGAAVALIEAG